MNENQESKTNQEPPGASNSSDLLSVRACNQAAKMAGIIERVMTTTARYAATSEDGLQRQFALSAYGLICGMGDMMNARDMNEHEDLEGVEELCKELAALIDNSQDQSPR